jgi:mannose-6-phosphate isomerase-like protein (cupin superfamily)
MMTASRGFETKTLPEKYDYLSPDGGDIRLLPELRGGGLCHCTLPEGKVSAPVYLKTVEELWYFVSGEGEVWRRQGEREETVSVRAGVSLSIPVGTAFQFRNTGKGPLCFIIATMPPWPGPDEAVPTDGKW